MAAKDKTQTTTYGASGKNTTTNSTSTSNKTSDTTASSQGGSTSVKGAAGEVSDKTLAGFNQATQDYAQSDRVNQAYQQLNGLQKPLDYQSTYEGQLGNLYDQIMKRDPFTWNMNSDKLYQEYKDLYQKQGQQAMNQTVGTAQALSGGYGNSYAMTAGQQAYQQYLQDIDRMAPQFENMAYKTYQAENENLMNKYGVTSDMDARDYAKYRDAVKDYQTDRAFFSNAYRDERNFDYGQYVDNRKFWQDEYWNERNSAQATDSSYWQNSQSTTNSTETTTSNERSNWSSWEDPTSVTNSYYTPTPTRSTSTAKASSPTEPVRDWSADAQYKLGIQWGENRDASVARKYRDMSYTPQEQAKAEAAAKTKAQNAIRDNSVEQQANAKNQQKLNQILDNASYEKNYEDYLYNQYAKGSISEDEFITLRNTLRSWR